MVGCSVYRCGSRSERKEPGISFHRFPIKDSKRLALWTRNMHRADWEPTKNDKLCSKHFEQRWFYRIGQKICLLDGAVPTVFEELPKYLQEPMKGKRCRTETTATSRLETEPVAGSSSIDGPSSIEGSSSTHGPSSIEQQSCLNDSPRQKNLKKELVRAVNKLREKSFKMKVLSQKVRRYKKKIISQKHIIEDLTKKNLLLLEQFSLLNNFPEISEEILQ